MDFPKLKAKAQQNRNNLRWKIIFAVGAWWDKTVTVYVPAPRLSEPPVAGQRHGSLDEIADEAIEKADRLLDKRAARWGREPPVCWDLAMLSMELT